MSRCLSLFLAASLLCSCAKSDNPETASRTTDKPSRIVSLDFCADQFVLKLVDRERILAVSPEATAAHSFMRETAKGVPQVRPIAEDALVLRPDLIVRSYGGGPNAGALFKRAGIPVVQIGWAGNLEAIRQVTSETGKGLGAEAAAERVIADMNQRLAQLTPRGNGSETLYVTSSGVTTGPGSLIDEMIGEAGLSNFERRAGWHSLPLETLAQKQPDLIATAFLDDTGRRLDPWSAMRHPLIQKQLQDKDVINLDSAWVACGGWFNIHALEAFDQAAGTRPQ